VELSGRADDQDVGVSGGYLIAHVEESPLADSLVLAWPTVGRGIAAIMGARPSGIPRAGSSRDGRSETGHARLPADIFSSTAQLGAPRSFRGDFGEWFVPSPSLPPKRP